MLPLNFESGHDRLLGPKGVVGVLIFVVEARFSGLTLFKPEDVYTALLDGTAEARPAAYDEDHTSFVVGQDILNFQA